VDVSVLIRALEGITGSRLEDTLLLSIYCEFEDESDTGREVRNVLR